MKVNLINRNAINHFKGENFDSVLPLILNLTLPFDEAVKRPFYETLAIYGKI